MPARAAIASCLLLTASAWALNPDRRISQIQKRHWQIEDGLPHNYVNAILHGPHGYLLIGTDEGVAHFDGARFSPAPLDPALHLDRRWIMSLMPSRDGAYWLGTYDHWIYRIQNGRASDRISVGGPVQGVFEDSSGALWYDAGGVHRRSGGRDDRFPACSGNQGNAWSVFAEDARHDIWIASVQGLCRYRHGQAELVWRAAAAYGDVLTVKAEPDGTLWAGTSRGLYRVQEKGEAYVLAPLAGVRGPVSTLLRDRDGILWVGTWGKGIYRLSPGGVESWASPNGLSDDFVRTLFEDHEGNLWIGSRSGGLNRWKDTIIEPFGIPEGLAGNFGSGVSGDGRGDLWFGTYRSGLYRLVNGRLVHQRPPVPDLDLVVMALAHDPHGALWVSAHGTFRYANGAFRDYSSQTPVCNGPAAIAFDREQRLWLGCGSGLYRYAGAEPRPGAETQILAGTGVLCLLKARDGVIWAGTDGGLVRIEGGRAEFIQGLAEGAVRYLAEDSAGRIWATTASSGLNLVQGGQARVLDARHGLPLHALYKPVDDGSGTLWVSSGHGILELPGDQVREWIAGHRSRLDVVVHDLDDGMRSIECHGASQPGGWLDVDGSLWFPTVKGFVRVQPRLRKKLPPPGVVIEEVTSAGKVLPRSAVLLPPGTRDLQIRFTALRFGTPDHVRFRYRLAGSDDDWTEGRGDRVAYFSALAPGKYRLQVSARDDAGEWNPEPAELAIEQLPRFHQTLEFKLMLLGLVLAATVLLHRWRMARLRGRYAAVTAERNRIAREWHDTLLAGLSGVSWQLQATRSRLESQPEVAPKALEIAQKMVDHCQTEARRVIWDLRESGPENPPLPQAIEQFLDKLCEDSPIQGSVQTRGEYVKLPYDIELNALRIAQEAISNAVHHGRPSHLDVSVEYTANQLMLRVVDDGQGFVPDGRSGTAGHFGILGMRERALNFSGQFEVRSSPGAGTAVEVRLPLHAGGRQ